MNAAGTPCPTKASTWSFISEISGEKTMAMPEDKSAGIWKQTDFPAPVGMIANVSQPSSRLLTTGSCAGRNSL